MLHVGTRVRVVVVYIGSVRGDDALALENTGARGSRYRRVSMIGRREHGAIITRDLFVLGLQRSGLKVVFVHCRALGRGGLGAGATCAAVIADIVDHGSIDHRIVYVSVVNDGRVHIGDGSVVMENAASPFAADKADSGVTEAIVNSAIEPHVRSPVTGVPYICATHKSPIARGPEQAGCGSKHPGTGNPEVAGWTISPVTRSPDVTRRGAYRLRIDGQYGRANVNGDANRDLGWGRRR